MKFAAFDIMYSLPGSSGNRKTVLVDVSRLDKSRDDTIIAALEAKDKSFKKDNSYCRIDRIEAVPLDNVEIGKLSITEFERIMVNIIK
jgi:hypothetical protein